MEDNNNPEMIEANTLSILAIRYRNSTNSRERDRLFMKISEHYLPKILKQISHVSLQNRDDFMQIYYLEIVKALNKWNMSSNFSTYLYLWIKGVYAKFMNSLKMFKQVRDVDEDGNVIYRSLEYIHLADMPEGYEPTYEIDDDEQEIINEPEVAINGKAKRTKTS